MKKIYFIIALVILIIFGILLSIRVISGEDNWICKNGEWVKHGNPSAEKPLAECKK